MRLRDSSRLALCSVPLLLLSACGDLNNEQGEVAIARGARVKIQLGNSCHSPGTACLSAPLDEDEIEKVRLRPKSGAVQLHGFEVDGARDLLVDVSGLEAGEATLEVTYYDFARRWTRDEIVIRVAEVDSVEVDVACEGSDSDGPHPMTAGASTWFRATAFDSAGVELLTGELELIADFDGFVVHDPPAQDDVRRFSAPSEIGPHVWQPIGRNSAPIEFPVYDVSEIELALSELPDSSIAPPGVALTRLLDGVQACIHDADGLALVEVVDGDCHPVVRGVEFLDALPINVRGPRPEIELSGTGICTIQAYMDGGEVSQLEVDIDNPAPPPGPSAGAALQTTPALFGGRLPLYEDCLITKNLTDGNCDILDDQGNLKGDADCLYAVNWNIRHYDGTGTQDSDVVAGEAVGAGLWTEVYMRIEYQLFGLITVARVPPNNFMWGSSLAGMQLEESGCVDGRDMVVRVMAPSSGDHVVNVDGANAKNPSSFTLEARTVSEAELHITDVSPADMLAGAQGNDVQFFVESLLYPRLRYLDAQGQELPGVGSISISTDDPNAGARADDEVSISTGSTPNVISLASSAAPQVHTVTVVDVDTITGVGGLNDESTAKGETSCSPIWAIGSNGQRIHGTSPVRPQARLVGDGLVVPLPELGTPFEGELCLAGFASGDVNVELEWGPAGDQALWSVP